jgi:hypothetical protein
MKSRTEYLRRENLKAVRAEVANFKRFRKLVDRWADATLSSPGSRHASDFIPTTPEPKYSPLLS